MREKRICGGRGFIAGKWRPDRPTGNEVEVTTVDAGRPVPDDGVQMLSDRFGSHRRNPLTQARIEAHEQLLAPRRWRPS